MFYLLTHGVILILEDATGTNLLSAIQASRLSSLLFFSEHASCMLEIINLKDFLFVVALVYGGVWCGAAGEQKRRAGT